MSKGTNREQEAAEKKILEALREAKRRVKATPASFDSDLDEKYWKGKLAPLIKTVSYGTSAMITGSGVSAARQANAPYDWFVGWAKEDLPDLVAQGNIKAHIELEKRENTWPARLRKGAAWFIGGVILAMVGVLVMWAMGLIGFK